MQPLLNPSVSIEAFEELGEIRRVPIRVGILIEPELRNLTFQIEQRPAIIYYLPVGRVIAAKLVTLATYMFNEISVLKQAPETPMLVMRVALQGEQPNLSLDWKLPGRWLDVETKIDLRIRASLDDGTDTIWVGTSRVTEEIQSAVLEPDFSGLLSEVVAKATDLLVADLMSQVRRSGSLQRYLEARR